MTRKWGIPRFFANEAIAKGYSKSTFSNTFREPAFFIVVPKQQYSSCANSISCSSNLSKSRIFTSSLGCVKVGFLLAITVTDTYSSFSHNCSTREEPANPVAPTTIAARIPILLPTFHHHHLCYVS